MSELEPNGTYRPQFHLKWRGPVKWLDRFPKFKSWFADRLRSLLLKVFDPAMVTTERVVEYPFVFQNLAEANGPVLDLGCVGSRMPIALASRGYRVIGVDFSPYMNRHPNFQAIRADAMNLPFLSNRFGAVCAVSVIEHIGLGHYDDPRKGAGDCLTVRELARILKPEGKILITVPFGRYQIDSFQRVYDLEHLRELLKPVIVKHIEYARSLNGLWAPCSEAEAAQVDWKGPARAVALIVGAPKREA